MPDVLNRDVIDEILPVDDEAAIEAARLCPARGRAGRDLLRRRLWAAIQVGSRPEMHGKRVVVIMPDSGERYVSLPFFTP